MEPAAATDAANLIDWLVKFLLAAGGLAGVGSLFAVRAQKRKLVADTGKSNAEADSILAEAGVKRTDRETKILDMYARWMDDAQEQLDEVHAELDRHREYVEMLCEALREAGLRVPPWPPRHRQHVPSE